MFNKKAASSSADQSEWLKEATKLRREAEEKKQRQEEEKRVAHKEAKDAEQALQKEYQLQGLLKKEVGVKMWRDYYFKMSGPFLCWYATQEIAEKKPKDFVGQMDMRQLMKAAQVGHEACYFVADTAFLSPPPNTRTHTLFYNRVSNKAAGRYATASVASY